MYKIKVGTSGYSYFWNGGPPTPFQWYRKQGFETVEINTSFYRFHIAAYIVRFWYGIKRIFYILL